MAAGFKSAVWWAAAMLGMGLLLWLLAPVLAPFAIAAVLAYVLNPSVNLVCRAGGRLVGRWFAVLLVESAFIVLTTGLALMIIPILAVEIPLMRDQLPGLLDVLNGFVQPHLLKLGIHVAVDQEGIQAFVSTYLNANFESSVALLMDSLKIGGSVALAVVGNLLLVPVVLFYLLMEWDALLDKVRDLTPPRWRTVMDGFFAEANGVMGQYLRGQLMVMGALAIYYALALTLFGLDLAIPIGVFTGLAVFVPYIGFAIGLLLASLASILQFAAGAGLEYAVLVVAVVYGIGQLLESFILVPRLVGERIGLHPLAVIFALMAFGQLFGFVGVLLALPLSALLLVALRRVVARLKNDRAAGADAP